MSSRRVASASMSFHRVQMNKGSMEIQVAFLTSCVFFGASLYERASNRALETLQAAG